MILFAHLSLNLVCITPSFKSDSLLWELFIFSFWKFLRMPLFPDVAPAFITAIDFTFAEDDSGFLSRWPTPPMRRRVRPFVRLSGRNAFDVVQKWVQR